MSRFARGKEAASYLRLMACIRNAKARRPISRPEHLFNPLQHLILALKLGCPKTRRVGKPTWQREWWRSIQPEFLVYP